MVQVRRAEPGDAAAVAALQVRSWQRAYRGIVPDDFLDDLDDDSWLERWQTWLDEPAGDGHHQLVATVGGQVVTIGTGGRARAPSHDLTGQLYVLYTHPDHWGQGHGGAVLAEIHRRLAADGHAGAQLYVAARNDRTIRFYEHHGWALDGTTQHQEVHGTSVEEARMVRDLR